MISVAAVESQPQIPPPECSPAVTPQPETHVFRSKLPDIAIPSHLPLHTYLFERLPECADRTCLIDGSTGETYTFARTHALCRKTAAALLGLGVRRGDVVMVLLQNCPEFALAVVGASMVGAVSTTANPFCTARELLKQFKVSGARLVLTQAAYVDKLREEFPLIGPGGEGELVVITTDEPPQGCLHFWALVNAADEARLPEEEEVAIRPDDPVALPFSSGTTGLPKGVVLTHRSLVTGVAQQVDGGNPNLYLKPDDVVLCVLPMFHIFSLVSVFLCAVRGGAALLLMRRFEIAALLRLIEAHGVTVAPVVPPLVLQLSKSPVVEEYDLSSIRIVLSGAAPLGKELEEALRMRVPQAIFGQGYGMTEAGPVISMCPGYAKQPFPTKSGSCGTVVRNADLKVIDPETGFSLRHNQPGEICIRGEQIMKGYLNDPEATARTVDVEGWLHTGDIGYVDDDEEIFIVDRLKELIKFKGFQVPPAELESLLTTHPAIADAAVVPQKDEAAGEVPVAFVVRAGGQEITEDAIKEFISKQVVFYKRLHSVFFVPAIPKSAAGKILRKDLRAKLAAQSSSQ